MSLVFGVRIKFSAPEGEWISSRLNFSVMHVVYARLRRAFVKHELNIAILLTMGIAI